MHRENDDANLRQLSGNACSHFQSGHARHCDIEQRDIRIVFANEFEGFASVFGFGYYLNVRQRLEHGSETGTDEFVVVGQNDAGRHNISWVKLGTANYSATSGFI